MISPEIKNSGSKAEQAEVVKPEFTVAGFEHQTEQILKEHLVEEGGIADLEVISINKTSKSIYGEVLINGERNYYKLSSAENIANELMGYRIAKDLPHKEITRHYFDSRGVYGLFLQEYCPELNDGEGLLLSAVNQELLTGDKACLDAIKEKSRAVFEPLSCVFQNSLITPPCVLKGANDRFFSDRLAHGARFDEIYSGRSFVFPSIGEQIGTDELFDFQISLNGHGACQPIERLVADARINVDPKNPRIFVVSQGDLIESNLTVDGTFFDFETGGLNALTQEMAISLCGIYFGGHYIYAKYSPLDSSFRTKAVDEFEESVSAGCRLEKDEKRFDIDLNFPFPPIKKALLENYLSIVIEPLEERLPNDVLPGLVEEFKSAILTRILAVKNILAFDEKELLLSLGLVAHFFGDSKKYEKISDFIKEKFVSIK